MRQVGIRGSLEPELVRMTTSNIPSKAEPSPVASKQLSEDIDYWMQSAGVDDKSDITTKFGYLKMKEWRDKARALESASSKGSGDLAAIRVEVSDLGPSNFATVSYDQGFNECKRKSSPPSMPAAPQEKET
jgi:hypothetical protein